MNELKGHEHSVCVSDSVTMAHGGTKRCTMHDARCTNAAKHCDSQSEWICTKLTRPVMSSPTNLPQQILATFGWTQNRVAKTFTRTLQMVSSRRPTRFGATSSYCESAINYL
jgi:hypothetical protein